MKIVTCVVGQIKHLQRICHDMAVQKGFYDTYTIKALWEDEGEVDRNACELIALMHTELSEAVEALRQKDKRKNNLGEEMADCVIRILDACEYWNIDLEYEILKKINENAKRKPKHGKRF